MTRRFTQLAGFGIKRPLITALQHRQCFAGYACFELQPILHVDRPIGAYAMYAYSLHYERS